MNKLIVILVCVVVGFASYVVINRDQQSPVDTNIFIPNREQQGETQDEPLSTQDGYLGIEPDELTSPEEMQTVITEYPELELSKDDMLPQGSVLLPEVEVTMLYTTEIIPRGFTEEPVELPQKIILSEGADFRTDMYEIDLGPDYVKFTVIPTQSDDFRTFEAGYFERYYFEFSDNHYAVDEDINVPGVHANVTNKKNILLTLHEGYVLQQGGTFTVQLR